MAFHEVFIIDYPIIFLRWSKFHQGLFVPVEGLVQSPLVTLRIQESFLFAAFLSLGANVLLVVQWPKWLFFVMLTVLLQEIRALVKCNSFRSISVGVWLVTSNSRTVWKIRLCTAGIVLFFVCCTCSVKRKLYLYNYASASFILIRNLTVILLALT